MLAWLVSLLKGKKREDYKDTITLCYDNMCHLDNLKVAKKPLPLPGDLQFAWMDIKKSIDTLHTKNHKDPKCKVQYGTDHLDDTMNTMACEQTFAWLSRFKKILCAMPKTHHHFYLHRLIKRRNKYISWCYSHGKRPIQPKVRHE